MQIRTTPQRSRLAAGSLLLLLALVSACATSASQPSATPPPTPTSLTGKPTGQGTDVPAFVSTPVVPTAAIETSDLYDSHHEGLTTAGGVTYVTSSSGGLYAFDAQSGHLRWQNDAVTPSAPIAADAHAVYALLGAGGGMIYALAPDSGTTLWQHATGPFVADIVLDGSTLYISLTEAGEYPSRIEARRTDDGSLIWAQNLPCGFIAPIRPMNGIVYAQTLDANYNTSLTAFSAAHGTLLWSHSGASPRAGPAVIENVAYVTNANNLDALQAETGALLWRAPKIDDTLIITADETGVYAGGNAAITALSANDGTLRWHVSLPPQITYIDGPNLLHTGGLLFYADASGNVSAYRETDGAVAWSRHVESSATALTLTQGSLVVATRRQLVYALHAADGATQWQAPATPLGDWETPPPLIVADDSVYLGTDHGVIQALRLPDGSQRWSYTIAPKPVPQRSVYSQIVTFASTVSLAEELHIITDLGLQPIASCYSGGALWVPQVPAVYGGGVPLIVIGTPTAPRDWLNRLTTTPGVSKIGPNSIGCTYLAGNPAPPGLPAYLSADQEGIVVRITFAKGTTYDQALIAVSSLGLRLASPCYEALPADSPVTWSPMGQGNAFAVTDTLLVETTFFSSTQWQQQLHATTGVTAVQAPVTMYCKPPTA